MSVEKRKLIAVLSGRMPNDILTRLIDEYMRIKQQFFLRKFQPSELNGARFSECVLRLLEYLDTGRPTPFGTQVSSERIIKSAENNTRLPDTIRFFIPRLTRVILDVRNKRDVAHAGGEVNPNYSDALLVVHSTDWILTEIVRHLHNCSIDEAQRIVNSINEVRIPIIAEVDGFVRVQDTSLDVRKKVLVILYYKRPTKVKDSDLCKWSKYSNASRFKADVLPRLDQEELIHYEVGLCTLLPKGIGFVEKNVSLDLLI